MDLKQEIEEIVEKHLPDESHFVVEVGIAGNGPRQVVRILIDADTGVSIETCASVSRSVGEELEAKGLMESAYTLELSSPGLDYPLISRRQYEKNIGRNLRIFLQDNGEVEGVLQAIGSSSLTLKVKGKEKGKKATEEELTIALEQVRKSIVLVSFK